MIARIFWLADGAGATSGPFAIGQLRSMWSAGQITARAMVCEEGSEDWLPAAEIIEMEEAAVQEREQLEREPMPVYGRRIERGQHGCLRGLLIFFGFFGLFFYLIPGLVLFALAAMIPGAKWFCSVCGNEVAQSATLCPACKAILSKRSTPRYVEPPRALRAASGPSMLTKFSRWVTKVK